MAYTNSPLVTYTKLSPNFNPRKSENAIKKITIHHMAGNLSVETCGNVFCGTREASANYGINGKNVGLYVEEKNRAWTSSSPDNDYQAVTIEVANSKTGGEWPVSDESLATLINLCVDICKRNNIKKLNYTGDKTGNLTRHNMFTSTTCPGPYLEARFSYIANEVNKRLEADKKPSAPATSSSSSELYRVRKTWADSKSQVGAYKVLNNAIKTAKEKGAEYKVFNNAGKQVYPEINSFKPYLVQVTDILNVRAGAGTNHKINTVIRDYGVYTIVEEKNGWGKLKSGMGWICLDYTKKL
jgi:hypothetical protein